MDFTIRELTALDLSQGFLETLARLAEVNSSEEKAREVFQSRLRSGVRTLLELLRTYRKP